MSEYLRRWGFTPQKPISKAYEQEHGVCHHEPGGRKVFLIVEDLKTHHGKVVKQWVDEHMKGIEVFYLPAYSPELNPEEYLNGDLLGAWRNACSQRERTQAQGNLAHEETAKDTR